MHHFDANAIFIKASIFVIIGITLSAIFILLPPKNIIIEQVRRMVMGYHWWHYDDTLNILSGKALKCAWQFVHVSILPFSFSSFDIYPKLKHQY